MKCVYALVSVLMLTAPALAPEEFVYKISGAPVFSMTHPDGWEVLDEHEEDAKVRPAGVARMPPVVSSRPSVGQLWYGTWVVDKIDDFEDAEHYLSSLTEHLFDDVEVGTFETGVHHGMDFRYYDGTAVYLDAKSSASQRESVEFFAAFFKPSDHGVGISLYVGLPSVTEQYRDELQRSLESIRPVENTGVDR